jgi:hypothetical protein
MYLSRIIYCMVLSTWLHTKLSYEGLDNVFALPNLQIPSFKFSQIIFAPFQKFVLMSSQCKLLSQQLYKVTLLTYDLESFWNFAETWKALFTIFSQNFSSLHTMRDLATSLKSPQTGTWTQNDLQFAHNNSKLLEILGATLDMCFLHLLKFSSIDDEHKKLSLSKEIDFKTEAETLNTWISLNTHPNDLKFLSHI